MPTIEPRITFTPSPSVGPLLRELATLTGKTPARLVREILDEMGPQMPAMIDALRLIQTRPQQGIRALQTMTIEAQHTLSQQSLDLNRAIRKRPGRKPREGAAKTG